MVLVLPAWRGFQQMVQKHRVHRPTLPRDVKVNKHQVERAELSTQLGNASSIGFESHSIYVEHVELSTRLGNTPSNGFESRSI